MGKILTLTFAFLLSLSAYASMSAQDVINQVKGRYVATFEGTEYTFLLRSSGDVNLLTQDESVHSAEVLFAYTSSPWGPDGLPVLHVTFLEGSDEDSRDFHLLLTVEKGWSNDYEIKLITAFTTFNDGPNDVSSYEGKFDPKLRKYNAQTKKYDSIKE